MPAFVPAEEIQRIHQLSKADLHLHFEGCITPAQLVTLAGNHGENLNQASIEKRYDIATFPEFLDLFKWGTSYLRTPKDYELIAKGIAQELQRQKLIYAEITLSVGVMLLRKQDVESNFAAIRRPFEEAEPHGALRVQWIFDAVRQFGSEKAMEVARLAVRMKSEGVAAFGLGGDEESLPASEFRRVYDYARSEGLHRVVHAGEMGGPQSIRDAIEILGAERVGHGIAAIHDEKLMGLLIERQIPLEICPKSNLCTGALAKLLRVKQASLKDHPLPKFVARGVPVILATDDPAMFRTDLGRTYIDAATQMGLTRAQLVAIAEAGFRHAFLPQQEKLQALANFRAQVTALGLL
jgi:adenosine deaminase/aminodeoxyfutalosine deaminase